MVVVIDDERDMRELILQVLDADGIEATGAGPLDALATLNELTPPVVLLDVTMPNIDGYEILDHVRLSPRLRNCFVIMLTARTQLVDIEDGFQRGADDYLTKPFAIEELVARVRRGMRVVTPR